ncbi:MAG: putative 2-aminoethylphosphonate ABC transporter permease subunit [Desulfobacterales bacterium]|nr:putative 2-aminoethylphosphonate ABC transporter permease subunit [Desulfobacterales bacterium]MDX2480514.1 putative 2-aminoethylphosphonate ABC transporter permease subunit [Desulfuromusa sp.]
MNSIPSNTKEMPPAPIIRPKTSKDARMMAAFMLVIAVYLVIALALPLYAMLSKSFTTAAFDLDNFEFQVNTGDGWGEVVSAAKINENLKLLKPEELKTNSDGRLYATTFFPDFSFRSKTEYRLRQLDPNASFLVGSTRVADTDWHTYKANQFRRIVLRPSQSTGLDNYLTYFSTPALFRSIGNSFFISILTTLITVSLAFGFAYALNRSTMRFKGLFRIIAMVPILVPSLLPGIALVYLFGNQGIVKGLLFGHDIYGPIGIVLGSIFFTFPHALIIITTALSISDARLYEAAISLRASAWKTFWTVTLPGARYGLLSASFVVFNLVITDFGLPKVIGGQYNMLAVDIYKQVIGQQNFEMWAVVSGVLLIPAMMAFAIDRYVQSKQVAQLSSRSVPYEPKPDRKFDTICLSYCSMVAFFILSLIIICQYAALVKLWPYNLTLGLGNYNFDVMDGGGWASYGNSIQMALLTALIGTIVVFFGAYMVEKIKGFLIIRSSFQFLAMLPMAIPGMVLGLAYIFFFNDPRNPLNPIYGTMVILVVCTVTHFYTVSHLTAVTALKQMDREFEAVASSLKQPFYRLVAKVTVPVCMPAILDVSIYLFVNAMTTVSAVIFLYSPDTALASVAVMNMDDAGDVAPAAAMGMMIFYTNVAARLIHLFVTRKLLVRTQAWRTR